MSKAEHQWVLTLSQTEIVKVVANRFARELNYRHVKAYPIMLDDDGNKIAFHLIHTSDHPEAPKLMDRAYLDIIGDVPGIDLGRQKAWDV